MGHKKLTISFVVMILLLGGALRLFYINKSPPSLNWDEAALGYNAWSLWKTGKDEFGTKWPLSLRSFDDYKPPLYSYLTAPIVGVFGLSEITIRALSVICGVASIALIFIICKKMGLGEGVATVAALGMATEPWAIFYSRGAWEANLSLTIFLISVVLWLYKKPGWGIVVGIINVFSYHSAKVYLPMWLILTGKGQWKKKTFWGLAVAAIFALGISGTARFGTTSIFNRNLRAWDLVTGIGQRYTAYFSPANLFVRGTSENNQKIDDFGPYYAFEFGLWIAGLIWLLNNRQKQKGLLIWLMLAPIPAAITWSWFNPIRVLPFFAANSIIIAVGAVRIWQAIKFKRLVFVVLGGWMVLNVAWLGLTLLWKLPYLHYGSWQWGFREVTAQISPILDKYDKVIWETSQAQPYIFVLNYLQYPPDKYQAEVGKVPAPRKSFDFGKFVFRNIYWPDDQKLEKTLFIGGVYSLPEDKTMMQIFDPQGYETARIVGTE